jgi:transcriptional regulator with XRE-family HTH domain
MDDPESRDVGTRLRAARLRRGWNRETLAFKSGLSWSAIEQIESGRRKNITLRTLSALSTALGVTTDYLVIAAVTPAQMLHHAALLYGTDQEFLGAAAPFLEEGIERDEAAFAVTSKANIDLLREALGPKSQRVEFAEAAQMYDEPGTTLGAYRSFIMDQLESGRPWVRIVGEPVWSGRSDEETRNWTRYESLINLALETAPASILCPYDERSVPPKILADAKRTHPEILDDKDRVESPSYSDPKQFVLGDDR